MTHDDKAQAEGWGMFSRFAPRGDQALFQKILTSPGWREMKTLVHGTGPGVLVHRYDRSKECDALDKDFYEKDFPEIRSFSTSSRLQLLKPKVPHVISQRLGRLMAGPSQLTIIKCWGGNVSLRRMDEQSGKFDTCTIIPGDDHLIIWEGTLFAVNPVDTPYYLRVFELETRLV